MSDFDTIKKLAEGDLVAGEYISLVGGKHTTLGKMQGGAFILTVAGHAMIEEAASKPVAKAKKAAEAPPVVAEVAPATALPVGADPVAAALSEI